MDKYLELLKAEECKVTEVQRELKSKEMDLSRTWTPWTWWFLTRRIKALEAELLRLQDRHTALMGQYATLALGGRVGTSNASGGAAAAQAIFRAVVRLKLGERTIGSACLVTLWQRLVVLTARHCLDPEPGKAIDVEGLTVQGHPLRHVVSFPDHDVTVLEPHPDHCPLPEKLKNARTFELTGAVGAATGRQVTLVSFPLAADLSVQGVKEADDDPVVADGVVAWLSNSADEAIGSYSGSMPNSSGGAVTEGPPFLLLVGMHVGAVYHEEGRNPRDTEVAGDQGGSGSGGGERGPPGAVAMETTRWSAIRGPRAGSHGCGGQKPKASRGQAQQQAYDAEVEYLLDNVQHKGQMGVYVTAPALYRLLKCYEELRLKEGGEA